MADVQEPVLRNKSYFPALTGLRALAAMMVFVHHCSQWGWNPAYGVPVFREWYLGVSIFFTLSGFLITRTYYEQFRFNQANFGEYWIKRFARIYPIYFLLLLVTTLFSGRDYTGAQLVANFTLTQSLFSYYMFTGIVPAWSLTVEECFYILAPGIFLLIRPRSEGKSLQFRAVRALVMLALSSAALWYLGVFLHQWVGGGNFLGRMSDLRIYNIFGRFPEFAIGIFTAWWMLNRSGEPAKASRADFAFVFSVAAFFGTMSWMAHLRDSEGLAYGIFSGRSMFPMWLLATGTAAFCWSATNGSQLAHALFGNRLVEYLGRISYIFYLLQSPFFIDTWHETLQKVVPSIASHPVTLIIFMNLIAAALYELVEKPMHRWVVAKLSSMKKKSITPEIGPVPTQVGVILVGGFLLVSLLQPTHAQAKVHSLPGNLAEQVLSETVPTAFAPVNWSTDDFQLQWVESVPEVGASQSRRAEALGPSGGSASPRMEVSLAKHSLEWVRVAEVLVLPRARLVVRASGIESGLVSNAGFSQPFEVTAGEGRAELPVALISGETNSVEIAVKRGGEVIRRRLHVRFKPVRPPTGTHAFTDPSCSRFGVRIEDLATTQERTQGSDMHDWMYVGCRYVFVRGEESAASSLEAFVYWDNVGQAIQIEGVNTQSGSSSLWPLRLRSKPGVVQVKAGERIRRITYHVSEKAHLLSLGAGVGPYQYTFLSSSGDVRTVTPLLTLYGSFFITETMRLVAFNAMPLHTRFYSDLGIYLNSESFRFLDDRVSVNLMLGGHTIAFREKNRMNYRVSTPQGFEVGFADAFRKGYNLSAGAFIYPPIKGQSYYNLWLRYGLGGYFAEFNYIGWRERFDDIGVYSRSVGISFGMPIGRFF